MTTYKSYINQVISNQGFNIEVGKLYKGAVHFKLGISCLSFFIQLMDFEFIVYDNKL